MFIASMLMLAQVETTFNKPSYFIPVFLGMFMLGAIAWLIAAVLGFARARLWPIGKMVFVRCGMPAAVSYSNHCGRFWGGN